MGTPLKLLLAEDSAADAELLIRALRKAGFDPAWQRVDTEADFCAALRVGLDLVISDYQMPQFTGLRALELARARHPEIPFIIISGTIGEETAVEAMRLGATDYLLKDRLVRLGPAIARALDEARLQRERQLREEDFRLLFAQNPMPMWVYDCETLRFLAVNEAAIAHYGYTRDEFLALTLKDIRPSEEVPRLLESLRNRPSGVNRPGVWSHRRKDGTEIMVETTAHRTTFQGRPAEMVLANDVTQRLAAEKALRESEARLRTVTDNARVGMVMVDRERRYVFANITYGEILDLPSPDIAGRRVAEVLAPIYEEQIQPRLDRAFAGERVAYELHRSAAGGARHYAVTYEPMKAGGAVAQVVVVITDITERKQAEAQLRLSELKFSHAFANNPAAIALTRLEDGRVIEVNDTWVALSGYSREEMIGRSARSIWLSPEAAARFVAELREKGVLRGWEQPFRRKSGEIFTAALSAQLLTIEGETAILSTLVDVTARQQAEMELRLFRALVDQSGDTLEVIDPATGRFLDVNQRGPAELGCTREEYLGLRVCDVDPQMSMEGWQGFVAALRQSGAAKGESIHRRKDGTTFPIEFNAKWVRLDRDYIVTVLRDITERRQAEAVVGKASRHVVRDRRKIAWIEGAILAGVTGLVYALAVNFNWFEAAMRWILAHEVAQMDEIVFTGIIFAVGLTVLAFRRWRESESELTGRQQMQAALRLLHEELERRVTQRTVELSGANRALAESEERFRELAENIDEVFWLTDPAKHQMLYISPAYEKIWGRTCDSLYAAPQTWLESVHPDDRGALLQAVQTKQPAGNYAETYRIVRPDGTLRWIRDRAFPVKEPDGRVLRIVGVAEDITERKKLEEQFLHAQRLEAVGTLASGVAHDLNNILTPILMVAGLLKMGDTESAKDREMLGMIERSAQRGSGIIRQLLTFSRSIPGERGVLQARHLLNEMGGIMRETFPRNLTIADSIPSDLWMVQADPIQLHQVLMNLCVNARDAMPAGGTLTLEAANIVVDEGMPVDPILKPGPHLRLTVKDTGHGIPAEIVDRIFDPFFTTKGVGKGTGLGLSTVVGIVKGHGGVVKVYSEPGRGTAFHVYLPAAEKTEAAGRPTASSPPVRGRQELILVVDDEQPIREATRTLLETHGHRVIAAGNGEEALKLFLAHHDTVRLVLTDIMMPEMDGLALIRALRLLDGDIPVIATSGLEQAGRQAELAELRVTEVLMKPCMPQEMLGAVRRLLDAS